MANKENCIRLKAYEIGIADSTTAAAKIVESATRTGAQVVVQPYLTERPLHNHSCDSQQVKDSREQSKCVHTNV